LVGMVMVNSRTAMKGKLVKYIWIMLL